MILLGIQVLVMLGLHVLDNMKQPSTKTEVEPSWFCKESFWL